eukprot:7378479-Prymnesium_polylepis.3
MTTRKRSTVQETPSPSATPAAGQKRKGASGPAFAARRCEHPGTRARRQARADPYGRGASSPSCTPDARRLTHPPVCRTSGTTYTAPRERGGQEKEQLVAQALEKVARGAGLREAIRDTPGAPYASLNKAWKAMGGDADGPAWHAYRASLPALPPTALTPAAAPAPAAVEESPLGPRLKRKASRYGDAVPYGKHGPWGMYREGAKEFSTKIAEGKVEPSDASAQLAAEGVYMSATTLAKKAKHAPGTSPTKGGATGKLSEEIQSKVHDEIAFLRKHDIPVTKCMVIALMLSHLTDEEQETLFPNGVSGKVYYAFLDHRDLNTVDTKPLESDRDLWLTSTVRARRFDSPYPRPTPPHFGTCRSR